MEMVLAIIVTTVRAPKKMKVKWTKFAAILRLRLVSGLRSESMYCIVVVVEGCGEPEVNDTCTGTRDMGPGIVLQVIGKLERRRS